MEAQRVIAQQAERFTGEYQSGGWGVRDAENEEHWFLSGLEQDAAEYAVLLLNAGGVTGDSTLDMRDSVEVAIMRVVCSRCERTAFRAQVDADLRCPDCQP